MYHHIWRVILLGFYIFVLLSVQGKLDSEISGDIESNPGPVYVVKNIVQGSFHQFNQRFGSTSSIQ